MVRWVNTRIAQHPGARRAALASTSGTVWITLARWCRAFRVGEIRTIPGSAGRRGNRPTRCDRGDRSCLSCAGAHRRPRHDQAFDAREHELTGMRRQSVSRQPLRASWFSSRSTRSITVPHSPCCWKAWASPFRRDSDTRPPRRTPAAEQALQGPDDVYRIGCSDGGRVPGCLQSGRATRAPGRAAADGPPLRTNRWSVAGDPSVAGHGSVSTMRVWRWSCSTDPQPEPRPGRQRDLSRGTIIPGLLRLTTAESAIDAVGDLPLDRFDPFTLVIVQGHVVFSVTSSEGALTSQVQMLTKPVMFTSSSLGDEVADGPRRGLFARHGPEQHRLRSTDSGRFIVTGGRTGRKSAC